MSAGKAGKKTDSLPRLAQGQGEVTKQAPRLGHQEMRRILLNEDFGCYI